MTKSVLIKSYHLFTQNERHYLLNVEDMSACLIDKETFRILEKIKSEPDIEPAHYPEEKMKKLGLMTEKIKEQTSIKKQKTKTEPPITNISLFLTHSCNLDCIYCYGEGGEYGSRGSMNKKTAFQAVDWLIEKSGKMKNIHIGFFGGEPFLKFFLMKDIVAYARKRARDVGKKVDFHATSNATCFDDEVISFIQEEEISVMVSFDGPRGIQDVQRPYNGGGGTYDDILPKIKKLLEVEPETLVNAVLVDDTDPEIVINSLREIGFSHIALRPVSQSLFNGEQIDNRSARDTNKLIHQKQKQAEKWLTHIQNREQESLNQLKIKSGLYKPILLLLHNKKRRYACGAGLSLVAVSAAGDVYLCHRFVGQAEHKLGNVFDDELDRQQYQKSPIVSNPKCSQCFARYYCAGGCKHDNAGTCGAIDLPAEDMCKLRRKELEMAAYIVSNLSEEDKDYLIEADVFPPKPCMLDF